jgi:hypothetical protein
VQGLTVPSGMCVTVHVAVAEPRDKKRLHLVLDRDQADKLAALAERNHRTVTAEIRIALAARLKDSGRRVESEDVLDREPLASDKQEKAA